MNDQSFAPGLLARKRDIDCAGQAKALPAARLQLTARFTPVARSNGLSGQPCRRGQNAEEADRAGNPLGTPFTQQSPRRERSRA